MDHPTNPLVALGNIVTSVFGTMLFINLDIISKVIVFIVAVGSGGSTWYYNHIRIKKEKNPNK